MISHPALERQVAQLQQTYRIDLAKEHVGNAISAFIPTEPRMKNGTSLVYPRHGNWSAALDNNSSVGVGCQHGRDKVISPRRQRHGCPVESLRLPLAAQASTDNNLVHTLGNLHSLLDCGRRVEPGAPAEANTALAEINSPRRLHLAGGGAAEPDQDPVAPSGLEPHATQLLDSATPEEAAPQALVLHVGHHQLAVDEQLARAVHRQAKVPLP